jgi:hypothetical protein
MKASIPAFGLSTFKEEIMVYSGRITSSLIGMETPAVELIFCNHLSNFFVMLDLNADPFFHYRASSLYFREVFQGVTPNSTDAIVTSNESFYRRPGLRSRQDSTESLWQQNGE